MLDTKHHSIIAAAALSATRPEKSNCARVHGKGGKGTTGITRKGLLGLSGLWVISLVLDAPMARATSISVVANSGDSRRFLQPMRPR